ncbi:MAG TPA: hypothetical protein VLR71_05285 [Casimicrobiaceae bacterium]|nr:hypothetical protein [Casimicrobiaceae bacterium]
MTRTTHRAQPRSGLRAWHAALVVLAMTLTVTPTAATAKATADAATARVSAAATRHVPRHASATRKATSASKVRLAAAAPRPRGEPPADLSLSDEFDRAELIERMLAECKGIPYNAFELAQTSGEALELPAPIQLMTVRVHHPYCADLLRTYARKTRV